MAEIKLGSSVRDAITGYTGIAIARCCWQNGCVRITIQSRELKKDGTPVEQYTIDEVQCELLATSKVPAPKPKHGPHPEPDRGR